MIRWLLNKLRGARPAPRRPRVPESERELAALRMKNNPNREPVGHYTGRCIVCHSRDLWDDMATYGCNACGAMFSVGHLPPLIVPSKQ